MKGRLFFHLPFLLLPLLAALPASAQESTWYLLSREDGCLELQILVKAEKLSRAPVSPDDFARMMRERGEQVVVEPLADMPEDFTGKAVQVKVG